MLTRTVFGKVVFGSMRSSQVTHLRAHIHYCYLNPFQTWLRFYQHVDWTYSVFIANVS